MSQVFQWTAGQVNGGNPITETRYDGPPGYFDKKPETQEQPVEEETQPE